MIIFGLLTAATLGGSYIASLYFLLRWFAGSDSSHVLPITDNCPMPRNPTRARWLETFRIGLISASAVLLLALEANTFTFLGSWVPGVTCREGWMPAADCFINVTASTRPGRVAALAILIGSATLFLVARRRMPASVLYPTALLLLGILGFGAALDLIVGTTEAARPKIMFKVIAGLQLTAAAGFGLGALVLRLGSVQGAIRCLLAHLAGACVRILGAVSMLAFWPMLPAASAVALIVVLLLVPGVATALTAAAALASSADRHPAR